MLITVLVDGLCPFFAVKIFHYEFLQEPVFSTIEFRPVQIENVEIIPRAERATISNNP